MLIIYVPQMYMCYKCPMWPKATRHLWFTIYFAKRWSQKSNIC